MNDESKNAANANAGYVNTGDHENGGLRREVQLKFRVTEAERALIYQKMALLHTSNLAAYLRKMAIDGYIISVDDTDLKAVAAEMQKIGININQIAKRVNGGGHFYEQDIGEIKQSVEDIWQLLRSSFSSLPRAR